MEAVQSPIFNLLDGLTEPNRRALQTPLATGFWREYNEWKERITVAQRQKRIGDILLLTEEIRNPLIKEDAIAEAGLALKNLGRNELALTQYRKGLEINSKNLTFRREEAFNLNRLGRVDEAITKIESLLTDFPRDTETVACWVVSTRRCGTNPGNGSGKRPAPQNSVRILSLAAQILPDLFEGISFGSG